MSIRSQSWNTARDLVGWQQFINQFEMEDMYGAFYITPEYTRSFRPCRIAGYLFGSDYNGGKLTITGSQVEDRGQCNDWLADYFGLPTDFKSTVWFTPRVSNFMVDLGFYLGLDNITDGLYFRVHAPITYTKWELGVCEKVEAQGTNGFDAGYMSANGDGISNDDLPRKFINSAINGCFTWGDMTNKLKYTKIDASCCKRALTRLSDIQAALGWNFLQDETYHLGLQILAGFPTGGKRCCDYLFSPVIGNGGHFELGGGLTSSARLWTSDDEESSAWVYLDGNIAHLFKRKLFRTFELKNKKNSRYMLVQEMTTPAESLYYGDEYTASEYQYNGNLMPLANITTCCTDISVALQGEATLKFSWYNGNWSFDLGYNIWGRTGEKVCGACSITENKYALKGDAFVIGFSREDDSAIGLAATESGADIHAGTNTPVNTVWAEAQIANPSIDNAAAAYADAAGAFPIDKDLTTTDQTNTSSTPVFLSSCDLDTCKTPSALSHKVFAHIGYAWKDDMDETEWTPFLGLGGEAEFAGKTCGNYSSLSQWGVWLKGGLAFD